MYEARQEKRTTSHTFTDSIKKRKRSNERKNCNKNIVRQNLITQKFSAFQNRNNFIIQRIWYNGEKIETLSDLNKNLLHLNPSITGISSNMILGKNLNYNLLNTIISNSDINLYDGIKRSEILKNLKDIAVSVLSNTPITCIYDIHGDKHFPGGASGTKFTQSKEIVNPQIVNIIQNYKGRIRLFSKDRLLYLTEKGISCPVEFPDLTVQINYDFNTDTVSYHGYPDDVRKYSLSLTKGGNDI